jgi:hypothetical protein
MRKHGLKLALVFWCVLAGVAGMQAAPAARSYDVVIAGAGTGGTAAALTAARLGAHVALVEETDWIGGQAAAAAVSTMDEGKELTPPSGFYHEFVDRLQAYYTARGKSVGTCYWASNTHCYEPSAIRKIMQQMIDEVNRGEYGQGRIDLILEDRVVRVLASGDTVTGAVTARGLTLTSKILIDATEYGDVLPLTPARYRSGRSIGNDHGKSCTQDLTYTLVIRKYPNGVPDKLVMKHEPPEYQKWLPRLRAQWRNDGNPSSLILPIDFGNHNAYRGLPDSANPEPYTANQHELITRTVINWFNDYPTQTDIFDRAERKKILCEAKLKTLANLYYLQHDMEHGDWSVADDEGYDTAYSRSENSCPNIPAEFKEIEAHFPAIPYIRESQRLVGEYTLTGGDLRRERQGGISVAGFTDSIAVGDYADDLHACDAPNDFEFDLEHLSDRAPGFRSGPFEVPLRALIPEKVDGLLAAEKNISESRLANGATRLQPITMLTGQAAGALAALAVRENKQPRAVAASQVQMKLLKMGSILAREPMADLDQGMMPWKAAQYVVAHQWLTIGEKGFQPDVALTRGEVATILDRVFQLSALADNTNAMYAKANFERPSFADVPLYSPIFSAVENWRKQAAIPACAPALFCPDEKIGVGEFVDAVLALGAKKNPALTHEVLRRNVSVTGDVPLTRIQAAMILFNSVQ